MSGNVNPALVRVVNLCLIAHMCQILGQELGSYALAEYTSAKAVHWNFGEIELAVVRCSRYWLHVSYQPLEWHSNMSMAIKLMHTSNLRFKCTVTNVPMLDFLDFCVASMFAIYS